MRAVPAMLRDRIEQQEEQRTTDDTLTRARSVLASACARVLAQYARVEPLDLSRRLDWRTARDRSLADTPRIEILNVLIDLPH